ncbi:MAG: hypothetical protein JST75_16540 [Bacteroidetes bacterium]|nr:hypothetical protein [Bacteroidota bacterium]
MSSRLEQFIKDHREEFDSEEPALKVWDDVHQKLDPRTKQETPVIRFNFFRWSAAAAVVILLGSGIWYFSRNNDTKITTDPVAKITNDLPPVDTSGVKTSPIAPVVDSSSTQLANRKPVKTKNDTKKVEEFKDDMSEEMYHYTKLIEIKHNELKKLEKDEPLLYKKFSGDVRNLDSVYHSLQKQLPKNSNREQLLEAMIKNLKLQIDLLNHQLDIIKQINHSKKSEYEKAYKSA